MPELFSSASHGGSSTSRCVRKSDSKPTGRLIKKIQCQLKLSVIQPPSVGPIAGATTTAMPYIENAIPRFSMGNVSARIACSDGCKPPPPHPCSTRITINIGRLVERPQNREQIVNSATQIM